MRREEKMKQIQGSIKNISAIYTLQVNALSDSGNDDAVRLTFTAAATTQTMRIKKILNRRSFKREKKTSMNVPGIRYMHEASSRDNDYGGYSE